MWAYTNKVIKFQLLLLVESMSSVIIITSGIQSKLLHVAPDPYLEQHEKWKTISLPGPLMLAGLKPVDRE